MPLTPFTPLYTMVCVVCVEVSLKSPAKWVAMANSTHELHYVAH